MLFRIAQFCRFFWFRPLKKVMNALSEIYGHRDSRLTHKHSIKIEIFKKFWKLIFRSKKGSGTKYGLSECRWSGLLGKIHLSYVLKKILFSIKTLLKCFSIVFKLEIKFTLKKRNRKKHSGKKRIWNFSKSFFNSVFWLRFLVAFFQKRFRLRYFGSVFSNAFFGCIFSKKIR